MLYGIAAICESYNRGVAEAQGSYDTAIIAPSSKNKDTRGIAEKLKEVGLIKEFEIVGGGGRTVIRRHHGIDWDRIVTEVKGTGRPYD
jgi:hypothetical protein